MSQFMYFLQNYRFDKTSAKRNQDKEVKVTDVTANKGHY